MIIITNATIYTTHEVLHDGWLCIDNGTINAMGCGAHPIFPSSTIFDAQSGALLPGFIDLHVHGGMGMSVMSGQLGALRGMAQYFATQGVTSFLAGVITDSPEKMLRVVRAIAKVMGPIENGASLLGAYLEGPYISKQAKGAHPEGYIRPALISEYHEWFQTGAVKMMVVAPEFEENRIAIKECVARGIVPCVGHTNGTYEEIEYAITLGARQATHTFNAMSKLHHRNPGAVGAVLTNESIMCELIADMVHVHPAMLKLAVRAKGIDKILLVTDAEREAGLHVGCYEGADAHHVVTNDAIYLPNGTLAGSTLTMNNALQNIMRSTGLLLAQAWPMTSLNQARQLGIDDKKGKIMPGYDADIVVLDPDDGSVKMTMVGGKIIKSP